MWSVPYYFVQQFGDYVAAKHQSEIASVSSDTLSKNDQWAALQGRANSGLVDVTFADALGALPAGRAVRAGTALSTTLQATAREAEESIAGGLAKAVSQDTSRTGVPQWTVAAEDTYGARLAGSYKVGDTAYNGAAASDSAYGFNFGLTARESGAAARTDISDAMRADPYHPDWKNYVGGEARAVGADVPRIDGGTPDLLDTTSSGPIWSSTKSKSAVENALGHWDKHKSEFPELQNAKQYAEEAKSFLINPPQGTLTKTNARGDTLRYDPGTNTFGVLGQDGAPRTMFRPTDGINYWNRQ